MPICPSCQTSNPQHHNFCQGCGRSLKHHICNNCGSNVEFDVESCPQCGAASGTYWLAIIEPKLVAIDAEPEITVVSDGDLHSEPDTPITIITNDWSADELKTELDLSPWDLAPSEPDTPARVQPPLVPTGAIDDNLEISPWDLSQPLSANAVTIGTNEAADTRTEGDTSVATLDARIQQRLCQKAELDPAIDPSQPLVATTYLDPECRYRLLDPVVIQLLKPNDFSQVRVIDRQPLFHSLLETLMEQQPVTLDPIPAPSQDSLSADSAEPDSSMLEASRSIEPYRHWHFWDSHGIPKVAQAYIALQVSLPGTIPTIKDSWSDESKTVTVVEDRSDWPLLADSWNDPELPSSQTIYWLDYTLRLWKALEPWQMRQSLLEIGNLRLDEDNRICLQRLYPEPVFGGAPLRPQAQLQLVDLAQMWKTLFDRSCRSPSPSLVNLLESIGSGELDRVEEVRLRLQQIAYELEPKQITAPLNSSGSLDLSTSGDSRTFALAQNLLQLEEAAATHTGKKRERNEDCFGIVTRVLRHDSPKGRSLTAQGLYILCDGMGGHAGGEIASSMTVELLKDYFATHWGDTLPDEQTIRDGIIAANEAVHDINQKNSAQGSGRMGTTLVLVLVQGRDIAVAHVGDSRCYGITPTQGLIQLTLDHEVGQQQILRGVDPEIAYGRPDSYQLTQAIGPRDRNYIAPDIRFFELQEDTLLLLASDGLTDNQLLENYWLTNVAPLLSANANLQHGVDRLIDFANEYNGHDNITAIVVRARMG